MVIGTAGSVCFGLIAVPAVLAGLLYVRHQWKVRRVRKLLASLPPGTRSRLLGMIDEFARSQEHVTILIPRDHAAESPESVNGIGLESGLESRFGGSPYAEAGNQWPTDQADSNQPATFLIQVLLTEPLPLPWRGSLITVFGVFDPYFPCYVYQEPSPEKQASMSGGPADGVAPLALQSLAVPIPKTRSKSVEAVYDPEDEVLAYDPFILIDSVPGLRDELTAFTRRPLELLSALLVPQLAGATVSGSEVVQIGGRPAWLQENVEMNCPQCRQPMRFLFQFGDLHGGTLLGDAGLCFVFGCDQHPNTVMTTVQMC